MKIIVTHASPDLDAVTSVWLIKKFLPGWNEAQLQFVPAGERLKNRELSSTNYESGGPIEKIGTDEVIHVDTGMGPLDHHQIDDALVCAASRTWDYVRVQNSEFGIQREKHQTKKEAVDRIVKVVVDFDHFKEVFWENPTADYHEFSLYGILEGLKIQKPDEDLYYVDFVIPCLDALLHHFENKIWAEKEIADSGKVFETKWGNGIGFETINDTAVKLAQKMGYVVVVRKDPRKGYVRVKARPLLKVKNSEDINLTLVYEQLKKMDPDATWFLHVSKKMLLNGSVKNPTMKPTSLSLDDIIKVIKNC